jgi:hypothetical protein
MSNVATLIRSVGGYAAVTAGTTQTQAGATALTGQVNHVTTGNANDGVLLPTGRAPGESVTVLNLSSNALKVYPASTGAINGGSASAAYTHTASKPALYVSSGDNNWVAIQGA